MSKSMAEEFEKLNLDGGIFVDFEDEEKEEQEEEMEPGRDHWLTPGDQVTFPNDFHTDMLVGCFLPDPSQEDQSEYYLPITVTVTPASPSRCTCGSHSVDPHLPPERHSTWCDLQGERK